VRINKAKELIAGGANIKEASYMVGFSDQAYFTRVFKKLEKMTPRSFSDKCAKKYK
jgi:AraC-like DNA-binding protein